MRNLILLAIFSAVTLTAQNPQTDIATVQQALTTLEQNSGAAFNQIQAALTQLAKDIPAATPPDPTLTWFKASPIYTALASALAVNPNMQLLSVIYTCPRPGAWIPSTLYKLGAYVADPNGNLFRLTVIDPAQPASGATAPVWNVSAGATTIDAGLTWTFYLASNVGFVCATGTGGQ